MQTSHEDLEYFNFVKTNDGSSGLYNHDVEDIYHSSYGAKSEAVEKFIKPLNLPDNFLCKKNLRVLDICYGIGYNTKAFLQRMLNLKYKGKIHVDALEYDKNLVTISPFVCDGFFSKSPEVSYLLLTALIEDIYANRSNVKEIIFNPKNSQYIEPFYRRFNKRFLCAEYKYTPLTFKRGFLHNIYYHCISQRNKRRFKRLRNDNFTFKAYFEDARLTVKSLKEPYDIIFLDAFTPVKLPTLWSLEFFRELFRLSKEDSLLVTYSNSAAVRHAMLDSGFCVGKLYDKDGRACGTCASKNENYIKHKLDDYDLGLIKTNAGVYFTDSNLEMTPEEILSEWKSRKENLNLESSSHYIKTHKKRLNNEKI